ncbi:MAG TPA: dipeptidase [Gammaproteobacteria bacterium]
MIRLPLLLPLLALGAAPAAASDLPPHAMKAAAHAVAEYDDEQVELLAELVRFRTVHKEGVANAENPEFRGFANRLREQAQALGLDFTDYGAVLVIGLGDAEARVGVVTHGDVQPADASKWRTPPFELDTESEPGKLIARGAEDDKAPIATAMYAMKAIKDLGLPLTRRIELIVGLTEESDHAPFLEVLERYTPPEMNIGIDASYPVVVAEKGWGGTWVSFPAGASPSFEGASVERLEGGAFMSQVPGSATIVIRGASADMIERIRARAGGLPDGMSVDIGQRDGLLTIRAHGKAAHSSEPWNGVNAITHAAALLAGEELAPTPAGRALDFINTLVGTGIHGERFGGIAYAHPFMGPLTVNLSMVRTTDEGVSLGINTRAPAGKSAATLEAEIRAAIAAWAKERGTAPPAVRVHLAEAYLPERPAQVAPLLAVFEHYTGIENPKPISIGGGTFARLVPNAVNFGPAMPGVPYTGHSTHEFITRKQMTLNLEMYTAMLAWLAGEQP